MTLIKQKVNKYNFEYFFKEYSEELFYHSMAIVNCNDVAKDIVHDSFIYVWNKREELDASYSLKAYLYRLVRNNSLNYLRHKLVERKYSSQIDDLAIDLNNNIDDKEVIINKVQAALEQLPPRSKEVIEKCFIGGMKYKEVAEELGISVNTVKTHISSGLKFLRTRITKEMLFFFAIFK